MYLVGFTVSCMAGMRVPLSRVAEICKVRVFSPLNAKLNPICHLLALLGGHPILHVNRIRVK
jgi:hypothetical protein